MNKKYFLIIFLAIILSISACSPSQINIISTNKGAIEKLVNSSHQEGDLVFARQQIDPKRTNPLIFFNTVGDGQSPSGDKVHLTDNPSEYPYDINPLNGLPVQDPETLSYPPAVVTITNWPPSARPQAGLNFSPIVFEWYIGEGMSRYQAIFYGDYPEYQNYPNNTNNAGDGSSGNSMGGDSSGNNNNNDEPLLGPIRSGRLPFEKVRSLYNGFLVMASAYKGVMANLNQFANIFGSDESNINSAMIKVSTLRTFAYDAHQKMGDVNLSGMTFDVNPPSGGQPANRLWFMYNALNQVIWDYDESLGIYNRYQYTEDGKNTFIADTDKLDGKKLSYSNIIIMYAEHHVCSETVFDANLLYINRAPAILFRDGQVYNIYWTTKNEEYEKKTGKLRPVRFIDDKGDPFPLKPGQTWIFVVPLGNGVWESAKSEDVDAMITDQKKVASDLLYNWIFRKETGSGIWATQYRASLMIEDTDVCSLIH